MSLAWPLAPYLLLAIVILIDSRSAPSPRLVQHTEVEQQMERRIASLSHIL